MARQFSVAEVRKIMDKIENIRNMSVIAHVDHGKSTLTDSLISKAGLIARAKQGDARFMDTRADEQARSITIKSTSVSLLYDFKPTAEAEEKVPYLINLIDSPGHVDFSSEVTTALRTTDGALVVVDCVEGVCTQTETVLRQALIERVKPVLFLNKVDRVLSELKLTPEQTYNTFRKVIENTNVIISTFKDQQIEKEMGGLEVNPEASTVGFGSGLQAWAFTLEYFYRKNWNDDPKKARMAAKMLWGDRFYNPETKKWSKKASEGVRGFNHFVMGPLIDFYERWTEEKPDKKRDAERMELLNKYKIENSRELLNAKTTKEKVKTLFYSWMPAGESLLEMIVWKLPNPRDAQKYRSERVYGLSLDNVDDDDEEVANKHKEALAQFKNTPENKGILTCDPNGPLMIFISKMVPASEPGRFYAFGRVYSGTVVSGEDVYVLPDGQEGKAIKTKIQKVSLMMGRFTETLSSCPAGNMVGLTGVDKFILKTATICRKPDTIPFKSMSFSVAPVVRQAVCVKKGSDLVKLLEGLTRLSKSDPLLKIISDKKTGEHILCCAGELHLEICLKDLQEEYCKGVPIHMSNPIVTYCEGVSDDDPEPSKIVCSKSANKHNRLFMRARPISEELVEDLINDKITMEQDPKERARFLQLNHDWAKGLGRKIWSLGSKESPKSNILVDCTKSIQNLNDVKDSIVAAFIDYTEKAALCGEPLRGVQFELMDATLHSDSTHRGSNQMVYCAWRALAASHLAKDPRLIEPVYSCEIQVPDSQSENAIKVLNQVKGIHLNTIIEPHSPIYKLIAQLPVARSFGFASKLRSGTAGKAFPVLKMDQWQPVEGKVISEKADYSSSAKEKVLEIRKRKGMSDEIPTYLSYHDRL
eukprot:GAHX01000192.1.p1 GENE.GAHX01000192.1~~GAHX01000192.1.p1  ORF type:complete len:872 (-),score=170.04 GAHX01000192.1:52-2667(-)